MAGRRSTLLVYSGAAALSLLLLGFIVFASASSRRSAPVAKKADAIVVLTGAQRRIEAGIDLLRRGAGARLLISGVDRRVSPDEVLRLHVQATASRICCIDFGYDALDTIGNAQETRVWAEHYRFTRLIVVTSSYHMPRSLNELSIAMPDVELIAHPVVPRLLADRSWWLSLTAIRVLGAEYAKLLPSYAKLALARFRPTDAGALAGPTRLPATRAAAVGP